MNFDRCRDDACFSKFIARRVNEWIFSMLAWNVWTAVPRYLNADTRTMALVLFFGAVFGCSPAFATIDILPQNITLSPSSAATGSSIAVNWQIKNNGTITAPSSNSQVRISSSSTYHGGSAANVGSLQPTGSITAATAVNQSATVTVPSAAGTYYVWVVADNATTPTFTQTNTANDFQVAASALTVTAAGTIDILPQNITLSPSSAATGSSIAVNWQIKNNGTITAPSSNSQVRISSSSTYHGGSAANVGSLQPTGSITAATAVNQSATVTVPSAAGTYYVWVVADNATTPTFTQTNTANDFQVAASALTVTAGTQTACVPSSTALQTDMGYLNGKTIGGKFVLLGIECTPSPSASSPSARYFKRFELVRTGSVIATAPANAYTVSYSNLLWSTTANPPIPISNFVDVIISSQAQYSLRAVMSDNALLVAPGAQSQFTFGLGSNVTATITSPSNDTSYTTATGNVAQAFAATSSVAVGTTGRTDWYLSSSTRDFPYIRSATPSIVMGGENMSNPIGTRGWGVETVVLESSPSASQPNVTYDKRTVVVDRAFDIGDPAQSGSGSLLVSNVDIATGNLHLSIPDLSVPAIGVPLGYARNYNSMSRLGGCAGVWRSDANLSLYFIDRSGGRQIGIRREDGRAQDFFRYTDGKWYDFNPGNFDQLVQVNDTTFRLYTKGEAVYEFVNPPIDHDNATACDNSYNVVSRHTGSNVNRVLDRSGNYRQYNYRSDGRVLSIAHSNGRTLNFTYDPTTLQVAGINDNFGRGVAYTYDTYGYLLTATDATGKTTQYSYVTLPTAFPQKQLATITDANGNVVRQYTYDTSRRVISTVDGEGNRVDFSYPPPGASNISTATTATFRNSGNTVVNTINYSLDTDGNVVSSSDGARAQTAAFNSVLNTTGSPPTLLDVATKALNTRKTPAGNLGNYSTSFSSPRRGDPTRTVAPTTASTNAVVELAWIYPTSHPNLSLTESVTIAPGTVNAAPLGFSYDTSGKLTQFKDALNGATNLTRDTQGRVTSVAAPQFPSQPTTTIYGLYGEITSVTHPYPIPASERFVYSYSASGLVVTSTDTRGNQHTSTLNAVGNVTDETHPLSRTVTHSYDNNHNRISSIEKFSGVTTSYTTFTYDKNNRLIGTARRDANGSVVSATSSTYDAVGRLATTTDAKGNATSQSYLGPDLVSVALPMSRATAYTYDTAGRLASVTKASGTADAVTETYTYDNIGRRLRTTYADATYDEVTYVADRSDAWVATRRDRSGNTTSYQYDVSGNIIRVQDPLGNVSRATYDANNNVKTIVNALGFTTTYSYDAMNRLTGITDANNRTWNYQYDNANNLTQSTTASSATVPITINRTYDALNRPLTATYTSPQGSGTLASYTYNDAATPRSVVVSNGGAAPQSTLTFDVLGRMTSFNEGGNRGLSYGYDQRDSVTSIVYPGSRTVNYVFDPAGRMATVTPWAGGTTTYSYNSLDQITGTTYGNGTNVAYGYDATKRLKRVANLRSGTTISDVDFTLDARGLPVSATMTLPLEPNFPAEDTRFIYDPANRITSGSGTLGGTFQNDDAGRITSQTIAGQTTTFGYNPVDLLTSLNSSAGTEAYTYNAFNHRVQRSRSGGTTKHLWSPVGSLPNMVTDLDASDNPQRFYIYGNGLINQIDTAGTVRYHHFDYTGNTLALTDGSGSVTDTYAYAPYGEMQSGVGSTTYNPFRFNGRYGVTDDGNGLVHMRARYFQPASGRFLSLDDVTGQFSEPKTINRYTFAGQDPITQIDDSGNSYTKTRSGFDQYSKVIGGSKFASNERKDVLASTRNGLLKAESTFKESHSLLFGVIPTGITASAEVKGTLAIPGTPSSGNTLSGTLKHDAIIGLVAGESADKSIEVDGGFGIFYTAEASARGCTFGLNAEVAVDAVAGAGVRMSVSSYRPVLDRKFGIAINGDLAAAFGGGGGLDVYLDWGYLVDAFAAKKVRDNLKSRDYVNVVKGLYAIKHCR